MAGSRFCIVRLQALTLVALFVSAFNSSVLAQKDKKVSATVPLPLTRTTTRHETRHFASGGTVTLVGAPVGSISVTGWRRSEVEITADVELHADTEENLAHLSSLNNFVVDEEAGNLSILTTGTRNEDFMRRQAKEFPKELAGWPWKIDYRINVPAVSNLEINAGSGTLDLSGIEGTIRVNATESDATLSLTGGAVTAIIQHGKIRLIIPARAWHGVGADIRLASGDLTVELPPGFSASINAEVLHSGRIENAFPELQSRGLSSLALRSLHADAGGGGAVLSFTVGDGTIRLVKTEH